MCQAYPHEKLHDHDHEHHHHHDIIDFAAKIAAYKMKGKTNYFSITLTYSPKYFCFLKILPTNQKLLNRLNWWVKFGKQFTKNLLTAVLYFVLFEDELYSARLSNESSRTVWCEIARTTGSRSFTTSKWGARPTQIKIKLIENLFYAVLKAAAECVLTMIKAVRENKIINLLCKNYESATINNSCWPPFI